MLASLLVLVLMLMLVMVGGCAKGAQEDPRTDMEAMLPEPSQRDGSQGVGADAADAATDTGDDGDGDGDGDGSADGAQGAACTQGAATPCTCDDGGEGERDCVFDSASPEDGFLSECRRCQAASDDGTGDDGADACMDGMKNGFETGSDCGGPDCGPCELGGGCLTLDDCVEGECVQGVCTMEVDPGAAGGGSMDPPPTTPPPTTPPPSTTDCRMNASLCSALLGCCKADGTCGMGVAPLCF